MTRRDLLRLGGSSLLYTALAPAGVFGLSSRAGTGSDRLFFSAADLPRIRANARTPLLAPMFAEWAASPPAALQASLNKFEASGEIVRDFLAVLLELSHSATVHLVEPSDEREASLLDAIRRIVARPHWDFFRDGEGQVVGIQRASLATVRLLYAREVLGEAMPTKLDRELLKAIAEKGCVPCSRALFHMEHPESEPGWTFNPEDAAYSDYSMERWPMILGANNLRSAPTGALGLGALALRGQDARADAWLEQATASARRFLQLFSADGSYFEGISYLSYSLRTALPFITAHRRLVGDVDWASLVNWDGTLDYIMFMQFGKTPDGSPDVVNFSDARHSVIPGAIAQLAALSDNPVVGYAAKHAGQPTFFYDFLWYRDDLPAEPPKPELLNVRNDLNWVICRSGWKPEDAVIAFRSGGPANHEHADRNHITFKAFGERLLNDHFGAAYDHREAGWTLRLTRAHNSILLDGRGHTYIDGSEGVNDSEAYATILQYEDHGKHVWWTSDATAPYIPDNYHIQQVIRTVLFAKPGVLVVADQIRFRYRPQTVDARFYPDNGDGQAKLSIDGQRFTLSRPKAQLHGLVAANTAAAPRRAELDVPPEVGVFPCVEVHSPEGLTHRLVTVLAATPGADSPAPQLSVQQEGLLWMVEAPELRASIEMSTHAPKITIL